MKLKHKFLIPVIAGLIIAGAVSAQFDDGGGFTSDNWWTCSSGACTLIDTDNEIGSTSSRIKKLWATAVDTTTAVIGSITAGGSIDLNGNSLILDADGDTSIIADTDDQIDVALSGADDFQFVANIFRALSGSSIQTNTISETTADNGVAIDGLTIKDGGISGDLTATGALYCDGNFSTNADAFYLQADRNNDGSSESWYFRKNNATDVLTINSSGYVTGGGVYNTNADDVYLGADANNDGSAEIWHFRKNGTTDVLTIRDNGQLRMLNNVWIASVDNAGTGTINMLRANTSDELELGAPLNVGYGYYLPTNTISTWGDMSVTSAVADGYRVGYCMAIDTYNTACFEGQSDGAGGADTFKLNMLDSALQMSFKTADPCGTFPEGSIFYNDTSDYMCYCDGAGDDVQMHDPSTACF